MHNKTSAVYLTLLIPSLTVLVSITILPHPHPDLPSVHPLSKTISMSHPFNSTFKPGISPGQAHPTPNEITHTPSIPASPSTPQSPTGLNIAAKAGIITASTIVFLLAAFLVLELTFLRRWRHARALQRAIEEVEREGLELGDQKKAGVSESKKNMVLESRVEVVVDGGDDGDSNRGGDGGSVRSSMRGSAEGSLDGYWDWDAGTDGDVSEDEDGDGDLGERGRGRRWERGRNGMSLPRREY